MRRLLGPCSVTLLLGKMIRCLPSTKFSCLALKIQIVCTRSQCGKLAMETEKAGVLLHLLDCIYRD